MEPRTPLALWLERLEVSKTDLERECQVLNPDLLVPRQHILGYAEKGTRPTPEKGALLSAATFRIASRLGRPNDGLTVPELLYPSGVPEGAVIVREADDFDDVQGTEVPMDDEDGYSDSSVVDSSAGPKQPENAAQVA